MLSFENDYSEGAHPKILEHLIKTNSESLTGYGSDIYCESAKKKICKECGCNNADIFFTVGGTQTNAVVISAMLKSYEGVVSAETGHVAGHEAGAIEYTGHKVLTLKGNEGKIEASTLKSYLETFFNDANHEHMVFPGMVYISHPTEYGTLYSKNELTAISEICKKYNLPLYMDGARLGYALASEGNDLTLKDIAKLCDVFYIGGTKVGLLCGEAVVFPNGNAPKHFMTIIKQHGALLAKGRLLGVQFDALFENGLYYEISKNAIETANVIRKALKEKGYRFHIETVTNQMFIILDNEQLKYLETQVRYSFWEKFDSNHTVIRFATSWATKMEDVKKLIKIL